jgi:hypothetical protein
MSVTFSIFTKCRIWATHKKIVTKMKVTVASNCDSVPSFDLFQGKVHELISMGSYGTCAPPHSSPQNPAWFNLFFNWKSIYCLYTWRPCSLICRCHLFFTMLTILFHAQVLRHQFSCTPFMLLINTVVNAFGLAWVFLYAVQLQARLRIKSWIVCFYLDCMSM